MLPDDIINLVMNYSIEPIYKLIPEILEKINKFHSGFFGHHPKMVRKILKNPEKYNLHDITDNPHPKVHKHMMTRPIDDGYKCIWIASVRTDDPEFNEWREKIIFDYTDKLLRENIDPGNNTRWLEAMIPKYKSKKFYDRYKSYINVPALQPFMFCQYPHFLDITEEESSIEFLRMLGEIEEYAPIPEIQGMNHPAIINELDIVHGFKPKEFSSEFIRKIMGPINPRYISMNPGAIHILKAFPHLIDEYFARANPKFIMMVDSGIITHPVIHPKLEKNDPELISRVVNILNKTDYPPFTGDDIKVASCRERDLILFDNIFHCLFTEPYKRQLVKFVRSELQI